MIVVRRIWSARALVASLIRRQFQLRYRQSFIGIAWAVVPSLATLAVGIVVFHEVAGIETGRTPYSLFALAGLVPWTFFGNSLTLGIPSVVLNMGMVTRLAFPRAVLPLSLVGVTLLDLVISIAVFIIFAFGVGFGLPATIVWFPLLLVIEIVLVVGIILLGSALNVFARDIKLAVPLVVQLWLLVTPIMYPLSSVPEALRSWYVANPMTGLVESFRSILVYGQGPDFALLVPSIVGALSIFLVGTWYFTATESRFADAI